MAQVQLEFRGIRLEHIIDYFKELGGKQTSEKFPIHVVGNGWESIILAEEEIIITSSFIVNAIHILFIAETEDLLAAILKEFRKKTTRVGG